MEKVKIIENYEKLILFLRKKGISDGAVKSFINNNKSIIEENIDNILDRLFMIYNNKDLYCILLTIDDRYLWSLYKDNEFSAFKSINNEKDSIVEMMVGFIDSNKIKDIYPDIDGLNLNKKIKLLKKCKLNSHGYHFE